MSLEKFLGLFTGSSPESLPEGGSPLCFNDDFVVGGVLPRPGLKSMYKLSISGYAGNAVDNGGSHPWQNPFNVAGAPKGVYSTVVLAHNQAADGLNTTDYGFSVTPLAVIDSLTVNVTAGLSGIGFPSLDFQASIIYQGAVLALISGFDVVSPNSTTDTVYTLSVKNADIGGLLTPAVVNDPSFGIQINILYGATFGISRTVRVAASQIQLVLDEEAGLNFNYLKTFEEGDGDVFTLALSNDGTLWTEDVNNNPGVLTSKAQGSPLVSISAYAGAGADTGAGGFPSSFFWTNPGNIAGPPDGTYATNDLNSQSGSTSRLIASSFGLAIPPSATILGITISLKGFFFFATIGADVPQISVGLSLNGNFIGMSKSTDFDSTSPITLAFGGSSDQWNTQLTPAIINDLTFGVLVQGVINTARARIPPLPQTTGTFEIDSVQVQVNYLLSSPVRQIQPNTFAQSVTLDNREFIAFSDLLKGTDIPRSYTPKSFNRLSQVGPGAPPSASVTSSGAAIASITQNPPVALLTGAHDWLLVSDSPSDTGSFGSPSTPGNIMTLIFRSGTPVPPYLKPGMNIVLSGFPAINGNRVNNDPAGVLAPQFYTVIGVGQPIPGQQSYDAITFSVNFTTFYNNPTPAGCSFQATEATLTAAVQVPNLEVGSQFNIAGTGGAPPSGYDGTWTVDETPNASQLQIVSTALAANQATYGFNLITGTSPVAGQAVTVANTLNGNGIFNVLNAVIVSVTAGTFTVNLQGANIPSAAEQGGALIFGTIFLFDPLTIVGTRSSGTILTAGTIAAGIRKICYSFLTDDGYLTQPSPIFTLDVTAGASGITVGNLLPGPRNVIARVVHLTPANGGNFYNILVPVTVLSNGQNVVNTATILNDNISTTITLSFSDAVLTGEPGIDVPGNNLFETNELGSPVALIPYADRLFAIGEQNKIQNLLNYSFDGGIEVNRGNAGAGGGAGDAQTSPAGWTVDPVAGGGGSVVDSPVFGWAYQIVGAGTLGSPSGAVGMITQPAFQDEFEVPIIVPSTAYSVRITASGVASAADQNGALVVDLFSPSLGAAVGTFTLPLSSLTDGMGIFSGTLLTKALAPVPGDLVIRLYATGLEASWTILVDRVEPFPTEQPNLSGQIIGSYQANFEAFDRVQGVIRTDVQNQQPNKSAFTLFDTLYVVKTNSLVSTQDNKTTQPAEWSTPRVISNVVGTTSIYGVAGISDDDSGEEWAIIAGQPGVYVFNGGEPIKIIEEIQELWDMINWQYGHTLWVTNDIKERRILIGVPMKTFTIENGQKVQNPWIPSGLIADDGNPQTPNIVLSLNYRFLTTASALSDRPAIHVSSFGGKLLSVDMARKWNIWSIKTPCAAFIKRQDSTIQTFFGNSSATGKIYQLTPGLLEDDGVAFWQLWTSHGFPTPEQEQGLQLGSVRKMYEYMVMVLDGSGELTITVMPDKLNSPYSRALVPNLTLPASSSSDVEVPLNETGNRLFIQFSTRAVGAGFNLSRIVLPMREDPWSPVRGINR